MFVDAVLRLFIIEPKSAVQWKEKTDEEKQEDVPDIRDEDSVPKPSPLKAFLGLCWNLRAITSMLIAFAVGIYMGGILDGALTLKVKDASQVLRSDCIHYANLRSVHSDTASTRKELDSSS